MELEEMKGLWEEMSEKLESNKKLTDKLIIEMTQRKYDSKVKALLMPEIAGAVVCLLVFGLMVWRFHTLDTWYLQTGGVLLLVILGVLPIFSLRALFGLKSLDVSAQSHTETIDQFEKAKKRTMLVTRITLVLSPFMFVVSMIISSQMMGGKNLMVHYMVFGEWEVLLALLITIGLTALFVHYAVNKGKKTMNSMGEILDEGAK